MQHVDDVVVTGLGMITPLGADAAGSWRSIVAGRSGIRPITSFSTDPYQIKLGSTIDRALVPTGQDPALAFAVAAAREALEDAGLEPAAVGLSLGTNMGSITELESLCRSGFDDSAAAERSRLGDLAYRLARGLGLAGPVVTASGACASAAAAMGLALDLLRSGRAEAVLAGGTDVLSEFKFSGHHMVGSMTREIVRPFDLNRSGMLLGEGAAFLVLESPRRAAARGARVHARFAGYGLSNDAHHLTAPDESGAGAALAITAALRDAGAAGDEVDYVNAHGTATRLNDVMEARALRLALGERAATVPCSSIKSMVGHLLGAASAVEAVATVLAIREGVIPPTINHETPDPDCDIDCVPGAARRATVNLAISNSFGFGGVNACLVFRSAQ